MPNRDYQTEFPKIVLQHYVTSLAYSVLISDVHIYIFTCVPGFLFISTGIPVDQNINI